MIKAISLILFSILVLLISQTCIAQDEVFTPDLSKTANQDGWKILNREVTLVEDGVYLNASEGDGLVVLKDFIFENGIIEADIKGKDVQGGSFVGIAFHGVDEQNYDAVYFRPFNFMNEDSVRRDHSVQYISHPDYTWQKLREEFPGKYENPINPVPDPNSFFHIKIVVEGSKIYVFVEDAKEPSLTVDKLSEKSSGWIALWVGNYSDGTFSNLKIIKKG